MTTAPAPSEGRIVGGYRLERPLGRGGMAEVWLGRNPDNNALAAVKILRPASDARAQKLFEREQRAVLRLRHPNIVPVFDVGDDWIATAYIEGVDLRHRMRSPISPSEAISLACAIGSALAAAHEAGIVHCDVKPANILLDRTGTPFLADFGIARIADEPEPDDDDRVAGTPAFMAPEQAGGDPTPRADQYALAKTLLALLTGSAREQPAQAILSLPEPLFDALGKSLSRALSNDPEERFSDVASFVDALRAAEVSDADAPSRLAPLARDMSAFAWAAKPYSVRRIGEHLVRADYRLSDLVERGAIDPGIAQRFRERSGYADIGFSLHAREERLGPLGPAVLARATESIVLLHGLFTNRHIWEDVAVGIARDNGLAVVLSPDVMGFGDSRLAPGWPSSAMTPAGLARALRAWLELIGVGSTPTVVLGHSYSAAVLVCAREDEIGGRVHRICLTPALFFHRAALRLYTRFNAIIARIAFALPLALRTPLARYMFRRDPSLARILPAARDEMADTALRLGGRAVFRLFWSLARARPAPAEELGSCTVVTTPDDPLITPEFAEDSIRAAGIPGSRWYRLVYGGHFPHLVDEDHPGWGARNVHEIVSLVDAVLDMTRTTQPKDALGGAESAIQHRSELTTETARAHAGRADAPRRA